MAEVLGVVASCISVVQMLGCLQQLRTFCRSVRDIPEDLKIILDEIECFRQIISQIANIDEQDSPVLQSSALRISLQQCEAATSNLEDATKRIIEPLNGRSKLRSRHLLRAILKKEDIIEMKEKVNSVRSILHLAVTCYNITLQRESLRIQREHLQMQQDLLQLLKQGTILPSARAMLLDEEIVPIPAERERARRMYSKYPQLQQDELCCPKRCYCACHNMTSVQTQFLSLRVSSSPWFRKSCDKSSCRYAKSASVWISLTQIGIQKALRVSFDIMLNSHASYITPSLSFQRVVKRTSPGFKLLWELKTGQRTDWNGAKSDLLQLFETGKASPKDIDPDGYTWLEKIFSDDRDGWDQWPNPGIQMSLFHMLAQMGTQINSPKLIHLSLKLFIAPTNLRIIDDLSCYGFDPSKIDTPSVRISLTSIGYWYPYRTEWLKLYVEWISKNLAICPGFLGLNPLHEAILIGSSDEVQKSFKSFLINKQDNLLGMSALHLAVFRPQHLEFLLKSEVQVDAKDRDGFTPLMHAILISNPIVAKRLIDVGADFRVVKSDPSYRSWISALYHGKCNSAIDVLDHIGSSQKLSSVKFNDLVSHMLPLYLFKTDLKEKIDQLQKLLTWGANLGVPYRIVGHKRLPDCSIEDVKTLNILIFNDLINGGHINSLGNDGSGCAIPKQYGIGCSGALELLLSGRIHVSSRNHQGFTLLHMIIERCLAFSHRFSVGHFKNQMCSRALESVKILLKRGSNPSVGDHCHCYCSTLGCTPFHPILIHPEKGIGSTSLGYLSVWIFEYLEAVRELKSPAMMKCCLLDILRLLRFEELELTHTCCVSTYHGSFEFRSRVIEKDEIEAIQIEEMELNEILKLEMQNIEESLDEDFEEQLLNIIYPLLVKRIKYVQTKEIVNFKWHHRLDEWNDQFECDPTHETEYVEREVDLLGLPEYAEWAEYEHSQTLKVQRSEDDPKYKKRRDLISKLQDMKEEFKKKIKDEEAEPQPQLDMTGFPLTYTAFLAQ